MGLSRKAGVGWLQRRSGVGAISGHEAWTSVTATIDPGQVEKNDI
jgi:hypothetical protein